MKKAFVKSGITAIALILAGTAYAKGKARPPKDVVSIETARNAATKSLQGKVQSEQLENEDGKWVYSFDLKSTGDSKVHEVQVDARTGKLLTTSAESDDEANEHENEANETD